MIKDNHLSLRAPEPEDLQILYKWENDTSLWHLGSTNVPFSKFVLEQYILNNTHDIYSDKQLRLMIDCKIDNQTKTIGTLDLFDFEPAHKRAGIGILITKEERNKGYAKKALQLVVNYCFSTLHLHQLFCNILENNADSKKLFISSGFVEIGKKKDWRLINNQWETEILYQLINKQG
ncbi:MAG: GNAT family N-acetyltransferase [Hyphomicrobiales bacterium]